MVNKIILIGRVGKEPEIRDVGSTSLAQFSLATTKTWKNKEGEKQEKTEWHNVKIWGSLVQVVENYVNKGDLLYLEGEMEYGSYENKEGQKVYTADVRGNVLRMLGGKGKPAAQKQDGSQQLQIEDAKVVEDSEDDLPF